MTEFHPELTLEEGMTQSGMSWDRLWLRQVSVGGEIGDLEVEAYVLGLMKPTAFLHDLIAQAINEHFIDGGGDHPVAYWSKTNAE